MTAGAVKLSVPGSLHGATLHEFLVRRTGLSGNKVKAMLDQRIVFVNGRRIWMGKHPLAAGDRVEFMKPDCEPAPNRSPGIARLWEDEDYLIVNKPAGLLTQGHAGLEDTMERGKHFWAVHRLDRDTSGCLLLARSSQAQQAMIPVFEDRQVEKVYHAIVVGRFPRSLKRIDHVIEHQPAVTNVLKVWDTPAASLLELSIETGRTHQIRRHMASAGFPVLGDKSYGTGAEQTELFRAVPRQMLHAARLAFAHPKSGHRVEAVAPWPADFRQWARRLRIEPKSS